MSWLPIKSADSWLYTQRGVELLITQVAPSRKTLDAWVELRNVGGSEMLSGLITASRYDLMGSMTVRNIVARMRDAGLDERDTAAWRQDIQAAVYDVVRDHLDGPSPIDLATHEPAAATFILRPLVDGVGATSIVGPGGVGKSSLALCVGCAVASGDGAWLGMETTASGPVLYVDWEADIDTHARRLRAFAAGTELPIPAALHYVGAAAPLRLWAPALARQAARLGVVLIIIDSVMLARAGEAGGEDTIAFFSAIRSLGVPTLLLDHKSRTAMREGQGGAYGSVINDNTVRLMWDAKGSEGTLTLRAHKSNNYARLPTISLRLESSGVDGAMTEARWHLLDSTAEPEPAEAPALDRIRAALTVEGPMTNAALARHLRLNRGATHKILRGHPEMFAEIAGAWVTVSTHGDQLPDPM
jgi:hypothetical protein